MLTKTKKNNTLTLKAWVGAAILSALLASCGSGGDNNTATSDSVATKSDTTQAVQAVKPDSAAPGWAPNIKDEMLAVIEKLASYKDTPIPKLTLLSSF